MTTASAPTLKVRVMVEIVLADGDAARRVEVWDRLVEEGYHVRLASDGRETLALALGDGTDLVVLDASLRDRDGASLCQELRRCGFQGGVILLTDPGRVQERILGLRLGADDVLTRPFDLSELAARVEACTRRSPVSRTTHRFGEIEVDLRGARVLRAGVQVSLSQREFQLLRCLVEHCGQPVRRAELLDRAWGHDASPSPQTVDVHIAWLRSKLETDPRHPTLIRTIPRVGYVLSADPAADVAATAQEDVVRRT
jgi:two-component system, OmpR family, alkaline phosphatase synthesis response regulator PhoP